MGDGVNILFNYDIFILLIFFKIWFYWYVYYYLKKNDIFDVFVIFDIIGVFIFIVDIDIEMFIIIIAILYIIRWVWEFNDEEN